LEAIGADAIVIRHPLSGAPKLLAEQGWISASVINAGDGAHEHPTQALLDALTIRQGFGLHEDLTGLKVLIVGDIRHSRVARSNILLLKLLGAKVTVAGPESLIPEGIEAMGTEVLNSFEEALEQKPDVVMMLRVQKERMQGEFFSSAADYSKSWSLEGDRLAMLSPKALIMHPGPMNRGFEISSQAADDPRSQVLKQVANGVAVRMAVLYQCLSGEQL
jgi:aspartate carbamoyltransferase catalytic subunit